MRTTTLALALLCLVSVSEAKEKTIDITSRKVTDPLLKISTSKVKMSKGDLKSCTKGKVIFPEKRGNIYVYGRLLKKNDVFFIHPNSESEPGYVDFSAITSTSKGVLKVYANNHPKGDITVRILKDGKELESKVLKKSKWQSFKIPFNKNKVKIEVKTDANDWYYEYAFFRYSIKK